MRERDILRALDQSGVFPPMNHPKLWVAASRLSGLRANGDAWAVVLEIFGYDPSTVGDEHLVDLVTVFGRHLGRGKSAPYALFHTIPIRSLPGHDLFIVKAGSPDIVLGEPTVFLLNDVPHAMACSEFRGSRRVGNRRVIHAVGFARAIAAHFGDAVFLPPAELARRCGQGMHVVVRAASWEHPDIADMDRPSQTVAFRTLASAIVKDDPTLFDPGDTPNSHWRHWGDQKVI